MTRTGTAPPGVKARRASLALTAVLLLSVAGTAAAFTLSGFVRTSGGAPIVGVDLDMFVSQTGEFIFLTVDTTDGTGHYSVDVPAADTYDLFYKAPAGSAYVDVVFRNQPLSGNTVRDVTMEQSVLVSGTVRDDLGNNVAGLNLDFVFTATGIEADAQGDGTNSSGQFNTRIPKGFFDVQFKASVASHLVGREISNVHLFSDTSLGIIVLQRGWLVKGRVKNGSGQAIANCDVDATDAGGAEVFIPSDNTNSSGDFMFNLGPGSYQLKIDPPAGQPLASVFHSANVASSDLDLGVITLPQGWRVQARLRDPGMNPVANVDLDAYTGGGVQIATSRDDTAADGSLDTRLPTGTWTLTFDPPLATRLVPRRMTGVAVTSDVNLGDIALDAGVLLSGMVRNGSTSAPVAGAQLDVLLPNTATEVFTLDDMTNASGFYDVVIPPGVYDLVITPASGPLLPRTLEDVAVNNDTVVDVYLYTIADVSAVPAGAPLALRSTGRTLLLELERDAAALALDLYDAGGRRVRSLWRGPHSAGARRFEWDGRDDHGRRAASGVYFARATAGGRSAAARVAVVH